MQLLKLLTSVVLVAGLSGQQFICNNYKFQDQCNGATASDGICGWGLFGCTSVAPLPSSPVVQVERPPPLVCPPYTAEAVCHSDPCGANPICFTNSDAECVVNNCIGEFEYLERTLRTPCTAIFVDMASMSVVDCNVKEVIREVDQAALEQFQQQQTSQQVAATPTPTSAAGGTLSQVDNALLGLPPVASPSPSPVSGMSIGLPQLTPVEVVDEPSEEVVPTTITEETEEVSIQSSVKLDTDTSVADVVTSLPEPEPEPEYEPAPEPEPEPEPETEPEPQVEAKNTKSAKQPTPTPTPTPMPLSSGLGGQRQTTTKESAPGMMEPSQEPDMENVLSPSPAPKKRNRKAKNKNKNKNNNNAQSASEEKEEEEN